VRKGLGTWVAGVLLASGGFTLIAAAEIPPPCSACSMGIWPKPFLYLLGTILTLSGIAAVTLVALKATIQT
jgi:hypothetical protein